MRKLFVENNEETILIKPEDIYYFEVRDKTVLIKTAKKVYLSAKSLNYFEVKLQNSNFYRCHRSFIINLDRVSRFVYYSKTSCEVGFSEIKETVPVSKTNISVLRNLLEY